ncbi:MAG: cytochrome b [Oceanospirillaceae bacterium]
MSLVSNTRNTQQQYGWVAIIIHWILALPIIGLFALGLYMMDLSYYDSLYTLAPKIHEAIGIVILVLMLFRVFWKLTNITPAPPKTNSKLINTASNLAHLGLYLLTFLILISGLCISFAGGQGIEIFDWFVIPGPAELFDNQASLTGEIHLIAAYILIALVVLHTLAAFKHHFIDKDTTLSNMLGIKEKQ